MYLSFLLVATFSSSFLPECLGAAFKDKCENFGLINGERRTRITWECFPNNTKICTTRKADCTLCDGQLYISSLTKPSPLVEIAEPEPETQAGRSRDGHRRGRFRFKREVSARRRSPRFGRGKIEDSDKSKTEAKNAKEEADIDKKETDAVKKDTESVKEETTGNDPFSCEDVCLEKDGKYAKGQFDYTTFKDCEGGATTEELKDKTEELKDKLEELKDKTEELKDKLEDKKEEEIKDENKNDADKDKENATDKEVKDEKKEAARRRRMRRF